MPQVLLFKVRDEMRKLFFCIALFLGCACLSVVAQQSGDVLTQLQTSAEGDGTVTINQDAGIADMMKNHVEQNKYYSNIDGYRIQIYSGSGVDSKKEAQSMKGMAMSSFPDQKVYLTYTAPFWRVRVGNFRNKSESLQVYYELKKNFPNCYPVKDNSIRIQDLQ